MAKIKVTGYLDTEELEPEQVDLDHPYGLSDEGYEEISNSLGLDDVEFELQPEED